MWCKPLIISGIMAEQFDVTDMGNRDKGEMKKFLVFMEILKWHTL